MNIKTVSLLVASAAAILSGCAGNPMRQYDSELKETVQLVKNGSVKQAIALLEKNNEPGVITKEKDLLYYFEKGELLLCELRFDKGVVAPGVSADGCRHSGAKQKPRKLLC